jgi:hypothetical protein
MFLSSTTEEDDKVFLEGLCKIIGNPIYYDRFVEVDPLKSLENTQKMTDDI